jgi:hypothetical protein
VNMEQPIKQPKPAVRSSKLVVDAGLEPSVNEGMQRGGRK